MQYVLQIIKALRNYVQSDWLREVWLHDRMNNCHGLLLCSHEQVNQDLFLL